MMAHTISRLLCTAVLVLATPAGAQKQAPTWVYAPSKDAENLVLRSIESPADFYAVLRCTPGDPKSLALVIGVPPERFRQNFIEGIGTSSKRREWRVTIRIGLRRDLGQGIELEGTLVEGTSDNRSFVIVITNKNQPINARVMATGTARTKPNKTVSVPIDLFGYMFETLGDGDRLSVSVKAGPYHILDSTTLPYGHFFPESDGEKKPFLTDAMAKIYAKRCSYQGADTAPEPIFR